MATTTDVIRRQIEKGGDRIWRLSDFPDRPGAAVAQALSRLVKAGALCRAGKGLYYRPRATAFGPSIPSSAQMQVTLAKHVKVFPSGTAAGSFLGLSTQMPAKRVVSTTRQSVPRQLIGKDTIVHTRRPEKWKHLADTEACVLELLRDRASTSELSPEETVARCTAYLRKPGVFHKLRPVVTQEPPRVRAMFGALCADAGIAASKLVSLHKSLNPLSRFDFGVFKVLRSAKHWQSK